MTYLPAHFSVDDAARIERLIRENSFATLLSFPEGGGVFVNHLPVILARDGTLIGHMARANPQWKQFQANPAGMLIFQGPHTYITPRWYVSRREVPTWNYAAVHLSGRVELVEGFAEQVEVLRALSAYFDPDLAFQLPADLERPEVLTKAIVSFRFHVEKTEAKFKLSQNRSAEDRGGVMDGLARERTDEQSRGVLELMRRG